MGGPSHGGRSGLRSRTVRSMGRHGTGRHGPFSSEKRTGPPLDRTKTRHEMVHDPATIRSGSVHDHGLIRTGWAHFNSLFGTLPIIFFWFVVPIISIELLELAGPRVSQTWPLWQRFVRASRFHFHATSFLSIGVTTVFRKISFFF
jgi:hypothetical protein